MSIYKVSYVVKGSDHPGGIINQETIPLVGDKFQVGEYSFEVLEVVELMPPRGDFFYFHTACTISEE